MPHQFLQDSESSLRDFFGARNPFTDYVNRIKTKMPLGVDIAGVILARIQTLYDTVGSEGLGQMADRLLAAPGDRTLNFGDDNVPARVGLGMPIAYDIWYLFDGGNVLTFGDKDSSETMDKMEQFFSEIDDAKPLLSPETKPTPGAYTLTGGGGAGVGPADAFGSTEYTVKEARFEVFETGNGEMYASLGPKEREESYAGYIAFPVGPLGVMWGISLVTESALSGSKGNIYPVEHTNGVQQGGDLLPPFDLERSEIFGERLISKGWLVEDDSCVEILAEPSGEKVPLHYWLRYWIKMDNQTIVPGEFVGLMCRPWPLHCWWYQETAPFLYSGNWVETEFYTSGVVKEVLVPDVDFSPEDDEEGNRYRIWVKNEEIIVKSTDFLEYEVDERVGLLKTWREGEGESYDATMGPVETGSGQKTNFNWQHLALQNTGDALNTNWVITPVSFYEDAGSNVGGI